MNIIDNDRASSHSHSIVFASYITCRDKIANSCFWPVQSVYRTSEDVYVQLAQYGNGFAFVDLFV